MIIGSPLTTIAGYHGLSCVSDIFRHFSLTIDFLIFVHGVRR